MPIWSPWSSAGTPAVPTISTPRPTARGSPPRIRGGDRPSAARAEPYRHVRGLQGPLYHPGQVVLHRDHVHSLLQPGGERGHGLVRVVARPVEPPVHRVLHPPPQRAEQRRRDQGRYRHRYRRLDPYHLTRSGLPGRVIVAAEHNPRPAPFRERYGWSSRYEAWIPQLCVTSWPGSSTSRSSPVTKAFGGQVMGSTASALRRRSGPSGSPVNTCSQR